MQISYATEANSLNLEGYTLRSVLFRKDSTFFRQLHEIILGFDAACMRHVFYSGLRVVTYEQMRDKLLAYNNTQNIANNRPIKDSLPLWQSSACAVIAGGFGQFVASPTDFVKVQLQAEGLRLSLGHSRKYKSTIDCIKSLLNRYGFIGMWSGCMPNVQRGAFIQIGGLTGYDKAKHFVLKYNLSGGDNWIAHGLASFVAGFQVSVICNPFDVVKTRMMNQPELFRGTTHCFQTIIKNEGFMSLYTGFIPIWARIGPWNMIFFMSFERLRKWYGLKSY